jgi:hypothetical protein
MAMLNLKTVIEALADKEHRKWLKAQIKERDEKIAKLEHENLDLVHEKLALAKKVETLMSRGKHINGGICLFRVKDNGKIDKTPLCHKCKLPIVQSPMDREAWVCSGCEAVFTRQAIRSAQKAVV